MNKFIFVISFIFLTFFVSLLLVMNSKSEQKARFVKNNMDKISVGMTSNAIESILKKPDTTYLYDILSQSKEDSVWVMQYYIGFMSADALRILVKNDTTIDIISHD